MDNTIKPTPWQPSSIRLLTQLLHAPEGSVRAHSCSAFHSGSKKKPATMHRSAARFLSKRSLARLQRIRDFRADEPSTMSLSTRALPAAGTLASKGIQLVVCDMAGTTVEEHGLVYKVLREAMVEHGLSVSEHEMRPWHGAAKARRHACACALREREETETRPTAA